MPLITKWTLFITLVWIPLSMRWLTCRTECNQSGSHWHGSRNSPLVCLIKGALILCKPRQIKLKAAHLSLETSEWETLKIQQLKIQQISAKQPIYLAMRFPIPSLILGLTSVLSVHDSKPQREKKVLYKDWVKCSEDEDKCDAIYNADICFRFYLGESRKKKFWLTFWK